MWNLTPVLELPPAFQGADVTDSGLWMTQEEAVAMERAMANPQAANGYSYVLNNPASLVDPLGLAPSPPPAQTADQRRIEYGEAAMAGGGGTAALGLGFEWCGAGEVMNVVGAATAAAGFLNWAGGYIGQWTGWW